MKIGTKIGIAVGALVLIVGGYFGYKEYQYRSSLALLLKNKLVPAKNANLWQKKTIINKAHAFKNGLPSYVDAIGESYDTKTDKKLVK